MIFFLQFFFLSKYIYKWKYYEESHWIDKIDRIDSIEF